MLHAKPPGASSETLSRARIAFARKKCQRRALRQVSESHARTTTKSFRRKNPESVLGDAIRMTEARPELAFATPRKLPKARELKGRVVVLDVAFASEASSGGFNKVTRPLIDGLATRLAAWVDHHDHLLHALYAKDPRFILCTKAEHGACPEIITPELVRRVGRVDTIVCHTDFDGLCSAAKWIREGEEPYPGADNDARAVDTRIGLPSPTGLRFDRAIRARPRDHALFGVIVRHLADGLRDDALWEPIDTAAAFLAAGEGAARAVADRYRILDVSPQHGIAPSAGLAKVRRAALVDATAEHGRYDKTLLLLLGQERAPVALLLDKDTLTLAARFDSGINFLSLLDLSGGMPTLVSVPRDRLPLVLARLGVSSADIAQLG